jgi:hypothetical protein
MIRFIAIVSLFITVSCNGQVNRDGKSNSIKNDQRVVADTLSMLKLRNGYEVMQLNLKDNPSDIIRIIKDSIVIGELSLPVPDVEVKNFSVDKIAETQSGFILSINWGGGKNFYGRNFYFELRDTEKSFYLSKIGKTSYSLESENETSEQENVVPPIRIDKVRLSKFIINE